MWSAADRASRGGRQAHPATAPQQRGSRGRAARRDAAALAPEARQPKSFRELFQFIKPLIQP